MKCPACGSREIVQDSDWCESLAHPDRSTGNVELISWWYCEDCGHDFDEDCGDRGET